ncbi:unnamed protein product [Adineta ricciae]|uniref:Uncharacterized protein n=1 Tax=Adineta ricciae TaxID=249248 RepID=A0A815U3Q4_ADIRI|nr:unnamed protein product [Adineta ricciae]
MRPKIDVLPSYEKAVQNLNEPPPSYATVIESEDTSSCTVSKLIKYTCKHFATYKLATALATVLILFSIVSLTALIIGVRDHSSCSRRLTPAIWLIVFGAFTFVCCWLMSILTMARTFFADPYRRWCKIALIIVSISICVFNLTWGFLQVALVSSTSGTNVLDRCNPIVMNFARCLSFFIMVTACCVFTCLFT